MKQNKKRRASSFTAFALVILMVFSMVPATAFADSAESETASGNTSTLSSSELIATADNTFTFTDEGVTAEGSGSSYEISGGVLTITDSGTYVVTGECSDGSIQIKKGVTGVTLVLSDLTLTGTTNGNAPIVLKKNTEVTIYVTGENTLISAEDPANEDSDDAEVADAFEGAAIKAKAGSTLTLEGDGVLNIDSSSCKNGIKGGSETSIIINSGTYNINAANTAIASDGSVAINGGSFDIYALNDGIKSEPEEDDTASAGTITITGGDFDINVPTADSSDGINGVGDVTITGGTFTIDAGDDAIHSDATLTIGTEGSESSEPYITVESCVEGFEGATVIIYSGTGSVVSSDDGVNAANSDLTGYTYEIYIYGGSWYVDAGGDGLDSNGYIYIYGGETVVFGAENGDDANTSLDSDSGSYIYGGTLFTIDTNGITPAGTYVKFGGGAGGMGGFGGFGGSQSSVSIKSGDTVTIKNSSGTTIYEATATKSSNTVILAGDLVTSGETYYLYVNGSNSASATAETSDSSSGGMGGGADPGAGGGTMPGGGTQPGTGTDPGAGQGGSTFPGGTQPGGTQPGTGGGQFPGDSGNTGTSGITLNVTETELATESTLQLTAALSTGASATGITWTSSNESVATVDSNGLVTALTYGTATITATAQDGSTATCQVQTRFYDAIVGVSDDQDNTITTNIASAINWMADKGITKGYSGVYFGSFKETLRKDFVIFLWRLAGEPEASSTSKTFSDVEGVYSKSSDTYKAIMWAVSEGIIQGYSDGTFGPTDSVTRGQVAIMLWKYAGRPSTTGLSSFTDVYVDTATGITANMVTAINWAAEQGLVYGYSTGAYSGTFQPLGTCYRFQMAIIMYRYDKL